MSTAPQKKLPERKYGPFHGGIGVAVWLNSIETQHGPRQVRSITIAPRRYRDPKTGEWKSAASFRPGDLTTVIMALEQARAYVLTTPLPNEQSEYDRLEGAELPEVPGDAEVPF